MDDEKQYETVLEFENGNQIKRLEMRSKMEQLEEFHNWKIMWKEVIQRMTLKDEVIGYIEEC